MLPSCSRPVFYVRRRPTLIRPPVVKAQTSPVGGGGAAPVASEARRGKRRASAGLISQCGVRSLSAVCTKHLSRFTRGRGPGPSRARGLSLSPRNSSVPSYRPIQTEGSASAVAMGRRRRCPVSSGLGGGAAHSPSVHTERRRILSVERERETNQARRTPRPSVHMPTARSLPQGRYGAWVADSAVNDRSS